MVTGPAARFRSPIAAIGVGGAFAGGLDIVYAMVRAASRGRDPLRSVQAVASGVLGSDAFQDGLATVLLGFALHFLIALGAAATFYLASRRIGWLRRNLVPAAVVFGPLVYLFMNFVVLPLSAVPFQLGYPPLTLLEGFVSHSLFVGLPIAWAAGER